MKKTIIPFLAVLLLVCSCGEKNNYISDTYFAMNTVVMVVSENKLLNSEVNGKIVEVENQMSRTLESSEIYKLNNTGELEMSDDTMYVLEKSLQIAKDTDLAFNPCMGTLTDLWDITSGKNVVPSQADIDEALKCCNLDNINIHDNKVYTFNGLKVDLGGVAKGYALEKIGAHNVVERAEAQGLAAYDRYYFHNISINLGGNVAVAGSSPKHRKNDGGWDVGITNPFDKSAIIGTLNVTDCIVSVSGAYERYFEKDGKIYHHIFDSKTGYPAKSDIASSVVISNDGLEADALSTALFVMGSEKALQLYNSDIYEFEMILIMNDKKILVTDGLKDDFVVTDDKFSVINV